MNPVADKADSFPNSLQMTIRSRTRCQGRSPLSNLRCAVITSTDLWKSSLIPIIIRRSRKLLSKYRADVGTQRFKTRLCCSQRMPIERSVA